MNLSSPAFEHNKAIPSLYTCDGKNISLPLTIKGVPKTARSLVLRKDGIWDHWIVWNIPPHTTSLQEGATPPGTEGKNTGGSIGYQGPCPPDKQHRYCFTLYALDTLLNLKQGAAQQDVQQAMKSHIIERAELIGLYERKK